MRAWILRSATATSWLLLVSAASGFVVWISNDAPLVEKGILLSIWSVIALVATKSLIVIRRSRSTEPDPADESVQGTSGSADS